MNNEFMLGQMRARLESIRQDAERTMSDIDQIISTKDSGKYPKAEMTLNDIKNLVEVLEDSSDDGEDSEDEVPSTKPVPNPSALVSNKPRTTAKATIVDRINKHGFYYFKLETDSGLEGYFEVSPTEYESVKTNTIYVLSEREYNSISWGPASKPITKTLQEETI